MTWRKRRVRLSETTAARSSTSNLSSTPHSGTPTRIPRVPLLLNLAILVVNFILIVAHTDSQERVLRATTRMACESPVPGWLRSRETDSLDYRDESSSTAAGMSDAEAGAIGQVPHARLLKYLSRVRGLDTLSSAQLDAVYAALEHTCRALLDAGKRVRSTPRGGAAARRSATEARERIEREVADRLRGAQIQDDRLLARLVRVVVSSAG